MAVDGKPRVDVRDGDDILHRKLHYSQRLIFAQKLLIIDVELQEVFLLVKVFQLKLEKLYVSQDVRQRS